MADGGPRLITLEELPGWIIEEDDDLLVVNKPGWVVCHPSKNGPFSSLVGALRKYTGLPVLHIVNRLDRETSGLVLIAKNEQSARFWQMAVQDRRLKKQYLVILTGELGTALEVDQPLGRDTGSIVGVKQKVCLVGQEGAKAAQTRFEPLCYGGGFTLARACPLTGRLHQIRVHAQWAGYPVVGDKLYGPDETLYLEFAQKGWTAWHEKMLPLRRQALHAERMDLIGLKCGRSFFAPFPPELLEFCQKNKILGAGESF